MNKNGENNESNEADDIYIEIDEIQIQRQSGVDNER